MAQTSVLAPARPAPAGPPGRFLAGVLHRPELPPAVACLFLLLLVGVFTGDDRWLGATALLTALAVGTVGLNFSQGAAGIFTLGTGAFLGVGGYSTAILTTTYGWSALAAAGAGVLISAAVGSLFALLTLRVSQIYLAIATLALVQIFGGLVLAYRGLTGGVDGIPAVPAPSVFGWQADTVGKVALFNVAVIALLSVGAGALLGARPGRSFRAVREDHLAAAGCGVRVNRSYSLAFVLAAVYGSVAGSLFAHTIAFVDPTAFNLDISVTAIAMLVIGGSGSVVGAIVGTALLQLAAEYLTKFPGYSSLLFGLVILFGALVSPRGIVGGAHDAVDRVRPLARLFRQPARVPHQRLPAARAPATEPATAEPAAGGPAPPGGWLEAIDVHKSFGGVQALRGVSIRVEPGQIHALIGPNGSGKSTLINTLSGLYRADSGDITLGRRSLAGLGPTDRSATGLARTYQNGRLFKELSVYENVQVAGDHRNRVPGALGRCFPGVSGRGWAELVIDFVGITHLEAVRSGLCGFGNQRRVELARALALDPTFVLLDEPAAGLSAVEQADLVGLLRKLAELGLGILLVEHSMNVVMGVADRVTVLDVGRVIGCGAPAEIRAQREVIDAYLGTS
jgi:branched-chain amino acid transport system permease protein